MGPNSILTTSPKFGPFFEVFWRLRPNRKIHRHEIRLENDIFFSSFLIIKRAKKAKKGPKRSKSALRFEFDVNWVFVLEKKECHFWTQNENFYWLIEGTRNLLFVVHPNIFIITKKEGLLWFSLEKGLLLTAACRWREGSWLMEATYSVGNLGETWSWRLDG